ncbi:hypothetical protein F511_28665 [Dorcoceras hygrometricum]|uniref:Uncharacterized protein n=1 Tax=Dorcoceras hygrometricum TaxID=472368 RepID=A0A2Z7A9Z7_9LAMI|nr:hypothetical protein F511_28665 [Dorcoceras hygrometricum]
MLNLVWVRDSVMNAVVAFFASFSINTMPDMESLKDLKEKEKLMMEWAETTTLATAVRRQMYVLTKYREMLLRTFVESYSRYLARDQPWNDMAVQVFSLLSAAHSQSLDDFKAQQQEHNLELVQPISSPPVIDSTDRSGVRLAHFYSIAKYICWVRPVVLINGVWTPLQESGYWRSDCALSLFVNRKRLHASVTAEYFDSEVPLIEPTRYWGAAPLLVKIWAWQRVCTEAIQFSMSGRLRPASFSSDIVIRNLGVERLPDYFLDDFEHGVNTGYFADFLSGSSGQSGSEFDSASSSGNTVYRVQILLRPPLLLRNLVPPLLTSLFILTLRIYLCMIKKLLIHRHQLILMSLSMLLKTSDHLLLSIHDSNCEMLSKLNGVELGVRGDLLKVQSLLRQSFETACRVLERQSNTQTAQITDLKKGLMAPVGTIFQDLFDIKKKQREQDSVIREDSADGIRFEFYRVLLRSVNDSVLISWNDVVEGTVSFQQMKISADSLLK